MADYGHSKTDEMLKDLEARIYEEYSGASKEIQKQTSKYLKKFETKDAEMLKKLNANEITHKEYLTWRESAMATGKRWEALKDTIDKDLENANQIANAMIRDHTYDVYALNHNYGTYEIENGLQANTSYTLYNHSTVERLVRDNPQMLPPPGKVTSEKIRRGELKRWNNRQVQSVMTQSILAGDSIPEISKKLATRMGEVSAYSHIRAARTMTTGAQNAGRIDSYTRAEALGLKFKKQWLAAHDSRVRKSHRELDGVSVPLKEDFDNECSYPGDPLGPAAEVYNCRCTLIADFGDDPELGDDFELGDMDFEEWMEAHEAGEVESYYKPIEKETLVGETLTEDDVDRINARWQSLDKEWHANVSGVKTTLAKEQEIYDRDFRNRVEYELQQNPRMRRSTAEKRTTEMLGPRPVKVDCQKGGDFNFETRLMTLNNRGLHGRDSVAEDIAYREQFFEKQKQRAAEGRRERTLGNVGSSHEAAFIHEYGHAVDAHYGISKDKRWLDFYESFTEEQIIKGVSDYAATNELELLAEIFCESYMGETQREMSKEGMKIVREITGVKA